jgi:hypothetical protein
MPQIAAVRLLVNPLQFIIHSELIIRGSNRAVGEGIFAISRRGVTYYRLPTRSSRAVTSSAGTDMKQKA